MAKRIQTHEGRDIVVTFDPNICIHSGICVRGLRDVFDVRRRDWVHPDAAPADAVAAQIERCPSGALKYQRKATPETDPS
jgi:uncharacterized Fe-S cluster protein YjdI